MENNEEKNKLILKVFTRTSSWSQQNNTSIGTTLIFTKDRLDIKYLGFTKLSFLKEDIISIEPYKIRSLFSLINWIRINHKIDKYFSFLVFGSMSKNSEEIIKEIESTGFLDKNSPTTDKNIIDEVRNIQKKDLIPKYLKVLIVIGILIIFIAILIH